MFFTTANAPSSPTPSLKAIFIKSSHQRSHFYSDRRASKFNHCSQWQPHKYFWGRIQLSSSREAYLFNVILLVFKELVGKRGGNRVGKMACWRGLNWVWSWSLGLKGWLFYQRLLKLRMLVCWRRFCRDWRLRILWKSGGIYISRQIEDSSELIFMEYSKLPCSLVLSEFTR